MTDPFAELREYVESFNEKVEIPIAQVELSELLSGADALLAMMPFTQHASTCELPEQGVRGICDCGFTKAYAALPEHLKAP